MWISEEQYIENIVKYGSGETARAATTIASETDPSISNASSLEGNIQQVTLNDTDKVQEEKVELTAEELDEMSKGTLKMPCDFTDPVQLHDPTMPKGVIITQYVSDTEENGTGNSNAPTAKTKTDGVLYPLIRIGGTLIKQEDILSMTLSSTEVLPTLDLIIKDSNKLLSVTQPAGLSMTVELVITSQINGGYKKIKLPFYVVNYDVVPTDEYSIFNYSCKFKLKELYNKPLAAMGFPNKNQWHGCKTCKSEPNEKPNNWEFLHYMAKQCGLGFAATDKCKEASDREPRLLLNYNSMLECIEGELKYAADQDLTYIFDWWIDLYANLTMVNLKYILGADVAPTQLSIKTLVGEEYTSSKYPKQDYQLVARTISNSKDLSPQFTKCNLGIDNYEIITDNTVLETGTCTTNNVFTVKGAGGNNGLSVYDIYTQEYIANHTNTDSYVTSQTHMRGFDTSGTGRMKRESLRNAYLKSKRGIMLMVDLSTVNFGLQRGFLVNVLIVETHPEIKELIVNNIENLDENASENASIQTSAEAQQVKENMSTDNVTFKDVMTSSEIEIPNPAISGIYYIDSVEFNYMFNTGKIVQTLYLIKKGLWGSYTSPEHPIHVNTPDK